MKRVWVAAQRSPEVTWEVEFVELAEAVQGVGEQVHWGLSQLTSTMEEQSTRLCKMLSVLGQQMGKKERRMGWRRLVRGQGVRMLVVSEDEEETEEPMESAETWESAGTRGTEVGEEEDRGENEDGALGDTPGAGPSVF